VIRRYVSDRLRRCGRWQRGVELLSKRQKSGRSRWRSKQYEHKRRSFVGRRARTEDQYAIVFGWPWPWSRRFNEFLSSKDMGRCSASALVWHDTIANAKHIESG